MCQHPDFLNMCPIYTQNKGKKENQHYTDFPLWSLRTLGYFCNWWFRYFTFISAKVQNNTHRNVIVSLSP